MRNTQRTQANIPTGLDTLLNLAGKYCCNFGQNYMSAHKFLTAFKSINRQQHKEKYFMKLTSGFKK